MTTKTSKFKPFAAALFAIVVLAAGAIIYEVHRRAGVYMLQGRLIAGQPSSENANLKLSKKDLSPDILAGSNPSIDHRSARLTVSEQQTAKKGLTRDQGSGKETLFYLVAAGIRRDFPELKLSEEEVEELSRVILKLRKNIQGFRDFDHGKGYDTDIRQLEAQRDDALWEFEHITGMSFVEFLNRAPSEGGIDNAQSDRDKSMLESNLYLDQP